MMIKIAIILLKIGLVLSLKTTPVKKCDGNTNDLFKSVTISTDKGVCTKLPCNMYLGKEVRAEIEFLVEREVTDFQVKCNASVFGMTVDYPIPGGDKGCDLLTNTYCPIEADTSAQLELKLKILPNLPKVNVDLIIYALNQNEETISCFEFSGKVM